MVFNVVSYNVIELDHYWEINFHYEEVFKWISLIDLLVLTGLFLLGHKIISRIVESVFLKNIKGIVREKYHKKKYKIY